MPTYLSIDGGTVVKGEMRFTSYSNAGVSGEIGQLIRVAGYNRNTVQMFCIRKTVLDFAGGGVQDFPLDPTKDLKLWSPSSFIPLSFYQGAGTTLLYFPTSSPVPNGTTWSIFRVLA